MTFIIFFFENSLIIVFQLPFSSNWCFNYFHMSGYFLCLYVCALCHTVLKEAEDGVRLPRTGISGGCEPRHKNWELNLHSLEEQPVFLTVV